MTTSITSRSNSSSQHTVTTELRKIMQQLGVEPQQALNRPFACWEDMHRWNQERHLQDMPLSKALAELRSTIEHTHNRLQQVQDHYESHKAQTERRQMRFAARCLAAVMSGGILFSLLLVAIG